MDDLGGRSTRQHDRRGRWMTLQRQVGAAHVVDRLEEAERVRHAVAREGIHHEVLLVRRQHFLRTQIIVEHAIVDERDVLDEGHLHVEARCRDRRTGDAAELETPADAVCGTTKNALVATSAITASAMPPKT